MLRIKQYKLFASAILIALPALAVPRAEATIISTFGQALLIPRPADAQLGHLTSNTTAFVWNEAQNVTLGSAVTINASAPGQYTSATSFMFGTIAAGSAVNSHLIHFNTVAGLHSVEGSITLDANIIGVIAWNRPGFRHLDNSDSAFGMGTLFGPPGINNRGIFDINDGSGSQDDSFTISADGRTISFQLEASSPYDEIRILTSVPGPGALTLLPLALCGTRRRRK